MQTLDAILLVLVLILLTLWGFAIDVVRRRNPVEQSATRTVLVWVSAGVAIFILAIAVLAMSGI